MNENKWYGRTFTIRYITRLEKPIICSLGKNRDTPTIIFELSYIDETRVIPFKDLDILCFATIAEDAKMTREELAKQIAMVVAQKYSWLRKIKIFVGNPDEEAFVASCELELLDKWSS